MSVVKAPIPTNAAAPVTPTALKIKQEADSDNSKTDNPSAISNTPPTFV